MNTRRWVPFFVLLVGGAFLLATSTVPAQEKKEGEKKEGEKKEFDKKKKGPPGDEGFKGKGKGFGGPGGQVRKVVAQFDKNKDGWLNNDERKEAREFLKKGGGGGFGGKGKGPGGFGGKGKGGFGKGGEREPFKPGPTVKPEDVKAYGKEKLYDGTVLRTLFLEFENKDWEAEMADFYHTDVEVPVTLTVDGKKYPNVGVRFRGASSYFGVGAGWKRSLNLTLDFIDKKQNLLGHRTLNLLNSNDDPSFLHTVLYSEIARSYIPAPKANLVKVVVNNESWGVYVSAEQFNKDFIQEHYGTTKGDRWKVQGSPGGGGGLDYVGDNVEDYKRRYRIKSNDNDQAWKALIHLCKVLHETPADKLEAALKPILDVDGVLWFLAIDNALINNDGYWVRASDFCIYRDPKGKFHLIPHDMNETFAMAGGGPGGPRGPGGPGGGPGGAGGPGRGASLDPLVGMTDARKPLRSKLLAVPSLKEKYLKNVRAIAEEKLDWKKLGPVVAQYRKLIEKDVEADTRKLYSFEAFKRSTADVTPTDAGSGGRPSLGLRAFADMRQKYLLEYPEIKKLTK